MRMMRISGFLLIITCAFACSEKDSGQTSGFFDFPKYFKAQIHALDSADPAFHQVISINGEPGNEMPDSLNWNEELEVFFNLDLNKVSLRDQYNTSVDSTGHISIERIYAKDTGMFVQEISTTRVNGEIQVIEAHLKKRSFIVDRDVHLSYQPMKGYGVRIEENYIWSRPATREIYTGIQGPGHLRE